MSDNNELRQSVRSRANSEDEMGKDAGGPGRGENRDLPGKLVTDAHALALNLLDPDFFSVTRTSAEKLARQRAQSRLWRIANPDRMRKLKRLWKRANPDKVRADRRGRDRKSNARRRAWLMKMQRGRCVYCRDRLDETCHIDHVIPRAAGGSNRRSNLQLTCAPCNLSKGARDPIAFAQTTGRLL